MLEWMELFERALMRSAPRHTEKPVTTHSGAAPGSHLPAADPRLAGAAATLSDLLRDQPDMLASLIDAWREAGDRRAPEALMQIRNHLANPTALPAEKRPPRLMDFVYPVV
jgi:hypothetical protein